jgi:micrococcal nuclease
MFIYKANITEVHDGDTLTADIDLGFGVWLKGQKFRLAKINTPELKGPTSTEAIAARERLKQLVLDRTVTINTNHDQKEKYGRWLATIVIQEDKNSIDVNSTLVKEGLAKEYIL